ncbi:MAG: hypothetical protein HY302_07105 [Opitutae bacterium]|nr:hypothetical protein [Opitutae bacterium]
MNASRILLFQLVLAVAAAGAPRSADQQAAVELYAARQDAEARTLFARLAAKEPADAEAHHYLGQLALRAEDHAAARLHHEKAVSLAPANSLYHLRLGDAYLLTGEKSGMFSMSGWLKKCKASYDQALALDPANIDARASLLEYYQDVPGFMGGGMEHAYAQADAITKLDSARGRTARAGVLVADKKYSEAFALYDAVLADAPADYRALYGSGRLAAITGQRVTDGIRRLNQCLALPAPENSAGLAALQWRLGMLHEKNGDKAAARVAYEGALKADPKFDRAKKALRALN